MAECVNCGHEVEARFIEKHLLKCPVFWRCEINC